MPMKSILHHPATILAALGVVSGTLGSYGLGANFGDAPELGLYMVFAGLWFGLVIGYGVWRWGDHSLRTAVIAVAGTWIAWEAAVNVGLQLDQRWLVGTAVPDGLKSYVTGVRGGRRRRPADMAGRAAATPALRQASTAGLVVSTGALFGLLLPSTSQYDYPAILLLPWQAAVAAAFGLAWPRLEPARSIPCHPRLNWPRRRVRPAGLRAKSPAMTPEKKRVAILISGRGSNMMSLIAAAREPDYPAEIVCVRLQPARGAGAVQGVGRGPADARHRPQELWRRAKASRPSSTQALARIRRRPRRLRRLHAPDDAGLRRALARPHAEHPSLAAAGLQGAQHARARARRRREDRGLHRASRARRKSTAGRSSPRRRCRCSTATRPRPSAPACWRPSTGSIPMHFRFLPPVAITVSGERTVAQRKPRLTKQNHCIGRRSS